MKVHTQSHEGSYTKHIKITFLVVYRGENAAFEFIKAILKEYKHCRKVINRHFNENLIMTEEEEEHLFQESKSCWICKKLIDNDDEKVNLYTLSYKW